MSNNEQHGHNHEPNIYDLGLQADLSMWTKAPIERRRILKLGGLGIMALLAGCGTAANAAVPAASTTAASVSTAATPAASTPAATSTAAATMTAVATTTTAATAPAVKEIPQETAGPYPADGSQESRQNLNVLTHSGIVRQDIRTSLGTGNVAQGIPTTIELTLVDVNKNAAPLAGYALYTWHCDRDGNYSMYSNGVTNEDYLRGVQVAGANGNVTFQSIFPACYRGRWPHVHFEVYPSLEQATSASNAINTSQLALPEDVCKAAYATSGYEKSVSTLSRVTLDSDNVFGDGHDWQVATVTGDATAGYNVSLVVGVEG
jgi:protocatechuate 3,4-dioxygenase beta subunit